MSKYILGIDQSTQGTKALLFTETGELLGRADRSHRQIVDEHGWVEHDPEEIFENTLGVVRDVVQKTGIDRNDIGAIGISNQRETALAWNRKTGKPIYNAVVWQCARAEQICSEIEKDGWGTYVRETTGIALSPYFSAGKLSWIMKHVPEAEQLAESGDLCMGNIDAWLIFRLTNGASFATDYSNAARTQLLNIRDLRWDPKLCSIFGIPEAALPELTASDANFGETDFDGYMDHPLPIHAVLGDSNGALFGQGCLTEGMVKATYGTGSSVMMNIGEEPVFSKDVVTSIAWSFEGRVQYVLEGNINYSGAVISWLKDDLRLISSSAETQDLALKANPCDTTCLVPAFSGLGAPYWNSDAKALVCGMTRTTGRNEFVAAALQSIAFQISDVVSAMEEDGGKAIAELRADGGPTHNAYLMQFQSDILGKDVLISQTEELSGLGAAYMAGIACGLYSARDVFQSIRHRNVAPKMPQGERQKRRDEWHDALKLVLSEQA